MPAMLPDSPADPAPVRPHARRPIRTALEIRTRRRRWLSYGLFAFSLVLMVNAVVGENGYLATLRARSEYDSLTSALTRLQHGKPATARRVRPPADRPDGARRGGAPRAGTDAPGRDAGHHQGRQTVGPAAGDSGAVTAALDPTLAQTCHNSSTSFFTSTGIWPSSLQAYGPWVYGILFGIIFAETGLVVTPFLPGDSLLFAVGALSAQDGGLNPWVAYAAALHGRVHRERRELHHRPRDRPARVPRQRFEGHLAQAAQSSAPPTRACVLRTVRRQGPDPRTLRAHRPDVRAVRRRRRADVAAVVRFLQPGRRRLRGSPSASAPATSSATSRSSRTTSRSSRCSSSASHCCPWWWN